MAKTGVLLMNIGTPSGSDIESVRKYLSEFLTDRDVINAPWIVREIVFNRIVVPRRAPKSAAKYQSIWMDEGSPLMVYSKRFADQLQKTLGADFVVKVGMRYGNPSIGEAIKEMMAQNIDSLTLVPLYPQFAQATTGSSVSKAQEEIKRLGFKGAVKTTGDFYTHPDFIKSWVELLLPQKSKVDHWLFSFHGLPVSQMKKISGCYAAENCCANAEAEGRRCYRAQCLRTAELLAQGLHLEKSQWSVSFQSRLGPVKWIEPYTDHTLTRLAQSGVKRLAICAPAFVVDGLETLEELNIEGRHLFQQQGGVEMKYVECLNDNQDWVQRFAIMMFQL